MPATDYDYFIIGQGLAGSILAFKLQQLGRTVLVIDNQHYRSSSTIAAGIINPITGHRFNLTNQFTQFHQSALTSYQQLEQRFSEQLYHPIVQQRLIKNAGQYSYWQQRQQQADYQTYLTQPTTSQPLFKNQPFGVAEIKQSAYVNLPKLLTNIKQWLIEHNAYQIDKLDYQQLSPQNDVFTLNHKTAKKLIFCEGHQAIHNPWLAHLPFKLAKGDILTLELTNMPLKLMLNWGNWLLPNNEQQVRLGSNFIWDDLSDQCNATVKDKLLDSLRQHTTVQANVTTHQTGIRPTTTQRTPFVGPLSNFNHAYCFNGFGSKGCLIIPYYADLLIAHCEQQAPLPNEITRWL